MLRHGGQSRQQRRQPLLPLDNIKGRPWLIYFSYKAERDAWQKTAVRDRLRKLASFLPKARWGRMLKVIH
jgi:signal peptidase I